ncbi:hypothetical protein [Dactylosporangium sp. CA-092794]|uniref:hypothetical protein n=1 Tax=Dactylosporangium sp. CA-092794 TaxID=3239929 RepID=UPI003D8F65BA
MITFGAALVSAMATDVWQRARDAVAVLGRRLQPSAPGEAFEDQLAALRRQVLAARQADQKEVEQALVVIWQARLQELLLQEPDLAVELQHLLDHTLLPMLTDSERTHARQIAMTGRSHDASTFNQFIGDQHNTRP